jgi:hypothetical protein
MINLFTNYYLDKSVSRQKEIDDCILKNVQHPLIDRVILFLDQAALDHLVKTIPTEKVYYMLISGRPSFNHYFLKTKSYPDDINIITNADIYFNQTLEYVKGIQDWDCYALSRWDMEKNGRIKHWNHPDSQDVWIFKGEVNEMRGADFPMGCPGNDNRIAKLISDSGYIVTNPSLTIQTIHLHISQSRNYNRAHTIPPPYKMVHPVELIKSKA